MFKFIILFLALMFAGCDTAAPAVAVNTDPEPYCNCFSVECSNCDWVQFYCDCLHADRDILLGCPNCGESRFIIRFENKD